MKNYLLFLLVPLAWLLTFSGVANAAEVIDPVDGQLDVARAVYDAFTGGHAAYAAALSLVLVVALARKYLGGRWQWMHTDAGATCMVLVGSFGTAMSTALAGGGPLTLHAAYTAALVAFGACGGYAAVKRLVVDPLAPRLPASLRAVVTWLFEHASDPSRQSPAATGNTAPAAGASN